MLVIHPKDITTSVLSTLYEGLEANVVDCDYSNKKTGHLLHHISTQERVMLLGHGSQDGLFYRHDDTQEGFDGIAIGSQQAYYLRRHGGNLIGIWCHAADFARKEGLHGLFSGMIVSEMGEAEEYGINTDKVSLELSNKNLFARLRQLLDEGLPMHEIPACIKALDDEKSQLSTFNYGNFYYL